MIDYIQPIMPQNWTGQERTFYMMLMRVLEDIHLRKVKEKDLDKTLVAKIRKLGSAVAADPSNTDWTPLELINCVAYNDNMQPQIRRKDGIVYIRGAVKRNVSTSNNTEVQITTAIPEIYIPTTYMNLPIITDAGLCRLVITDTGNVNIQNKSGGSLSANAFISLDCCYSL